MKEARHKYIADLLKKNSIVKTNELVRDLNVSIETIRRDFNQLEKEGIIEKTYGGAVISNNHLYTELGAWQERREKCRKEKQLLARRAADHIPDGSLVAVDAGTTMYELSRHISQKHDITLITNDLFIVREMLKNDNNNTYIIGGLMAKTGSSSGSFAREMISNFAKIDVCIISTECVTLEDGFTTVSSQINDLKKLFIERAIKIVAVVDHSKFGQKALFRTCHFSDIDLLITDSLTPEKIINSIRESGTPVEIVTIGQNE